MAPSRLPVVFFRTKAGKVPVLEWLKAMNAPDRRVIGLDLLRVQENWPIGMPLCKSLGGGLWEVRSSLRGGRIARLMFAISGGEIYVLHGFFKTTRKTPEIELAMALKRKSEIDGEIH